MNNFGIVTRYTMRAFPQGQILGGDRIYSSAQRDTLANEAFKLTTIWKNDADMAFYYGYSYNQTLDKFSISFSQEYTQSVIQPAPFVELNRIRYKSSTVRIDRMSNLSLEGASHTPSGGQ